MVRIRSVDIGMMGAVVSLAVPVSYSGASPSIDPILFARLFTDFLPAEDAATVLKRATAQEATGKYQEAAETYAKAAELFAAAGQTNEQAAAVGKSAEMYERLADQLTASPAGKAALPAIAKKTAPHQTPVSFKTVAPALKLPTLAPRPGSIIGRVARQNGGAAPRITIDYSGFEAGKLGNYNVSHRLIETVTGSVQAGSGSYSIKVPPGAYRVSGYATYSFHGRTYNFELEPLNEPARHDYDGLGLDKLRGGLVRDFILKLTGKKAKAAEDTETAYRFAYHGGRLVLDCRQAEGVLGGGIGFQRSLGATYPPDSIIHLTLTPQGSLVDGSSGHAITSDLRLGDDGKYTFNLRGIVPGVYTATAQLTTAAGQTAPLRLSSTRARTILKGAGQYDRVVVDWQPAVTVDFLPNDVGPIPRTGVKEITLYLGSESARP